MEIASVDGGNKNVKYVSRFGVGCFNSAIGEYRDRNMENQHGEDDMVFKYQDRIGFAGTLAEIESEFGGSIMSDTKAHEDAIIRILLALHRMPATEFQIVVGQPISRHEPNEKNKIKNKLLGAHDLTVNGEKKIIRIHRVEVAAEGGAAFWSHPREGLVRILDVGSGTVNCASVLNGRYIDQSSFTINYGCNTVKSHDLKEMVRGIHRYTSTKWESSDTVLLAGGVAEKLLPYVQEHYFDCGLLQPIYSNKYLNPIYANAVGFYNIGVSLYGQSDKS